MITAALLLSLVAQDSLLPLKLRQEWVRGDDSDTLVSFTRLTYNQVAVGPDDQVYALDRDRSRIVILDSRGKTLKPIGRKGGGPGELGGPVSLTVTPAGTLLVYDFTLRGFAAWDSKRTVLPLSRPFSRPGIPNIIRALNDTSLYFNTVTQDSSYLLRYSPAGATVFRSFPMPESKLVGKGVCGLTDYWLPPAFSPVMSWTTVGSAVAVSFGTESAITLTDASGSSRVLRSPRKPRETTRQMAINQLGESRQVVPGQPACTYPAAKIVEATGVAAHLPAYQRLITASPTTLWAVRYLLKGEDGFADIYDLKAGFRGSVALGKARPVAFLKNGRMLSLETTEDDVPILVVYSISTAKS